MKKISYIILPLTLIALSACDFEISGSSYPISSFLPSSSSKSSKITGETSNTGSSSSISQSTSSSSSTITPTKALKEEYKHDIIKNNVYEGNYYSSITSTDKETLISELNTLINTGYNKYSYSNQSSNLKITDSYDGNYVECLYSGERMDKDNIGSNAGQWNKEHIWAKTYGFNNKDNPDSYQAYSDIQMLRVTESSINGKRSDKYFDDVISSNSSYGCLWTDAAFVPRDEVKGDVARIMFYMTVMYNDDTLNLELTDDVNLINSSAKQLGGTAYLGKLSTLLKWAAEDPVDEREISRNNAVYSIQNNRNPFIDHPEYAYYIFKEECDSLSLSYDDFYDNNTFVASNSEAIEYMNSLVDSIGEVTLEKESLINEINGYYTQLDSETNSFFTGYAKLEDATYKLQVLKDLASRDTTIDTTLDLTIFSSSSGETAKNGVNLAFSASMSNAGKGIYAQTSKAITMDITNLYDNIKSCSITYKCNKNTPKGTITITDGSKSTTIEISASQSNQVANIDLTGFNLSNGLTITITNNTGNSIIVPTITFKI